MPRSIARAARRAAAAAVASAAAAVVAAATALGACADVRYPADGALVFRCNGGGSCPRGFRCSADYCIAAGDPPLPALLARSARSFRPVVHADPDRDGLLACWTVSDDLGTDHAAVYAAFMNRAGAVQPTVRLATVDARAAAFIGSCAPIPGTNGKVLVATVTDDGQREAIALHVWTPDAGNPYAGPAATLFFTEPSPVRPNVALASIDLDVLGNAVWVPARQLARPTPDAAVETQLVRFRVDAAALAAGRPARDVVVSRPMGASPFHVAFRCAAGADGCWIYLRSVLDVVGFVPTGASMTAPAALYSPFPPSNFLGFALAARAQEAAMLWFGMDEPQSSRRLYRAAWMGRDAMRLGPLVPFRRVETEFPAAMSDGRFLFLVGAPVGAPVSPRPAPGTDGGGADGGGLDAGGVAPSGGGEDAGGRRRGALTLYRAPWNAESGAAWEAVRTIPRARLGDRPVPAAAAAPLPGNEAFGLAWVEFVEAETAGGQGAHHVLFFERVEF